MGSSTNQTGIRSRFLAPLIVMAAAVLWRVAFFSQIQGTPATDWHAWDQSDMHTYWLQAESLAAGDWLGRRPYYPYHTWMQGEQMSCFRITTLSHLQVIISNHE